MPCVVETNPNQSPRSDPNRSSHRNAYEVYATNDALYNSCVIFLGQWPQPIWFWCPWEAKDKIISWTFESKVSKTENESYL